jgi:hypothetical protein
MSGEWLRWHICDAARPSEAPAIKAQVRASCVVRLSGSHSIEYRPAAGAGGASETICLLSWVGYALMLRRVIFVVGMPEIVRFEVVDVKYREIEFFVFSQNHCALRSAMRGVGLGVQGSPTSLFL